MRQCDDEQAQKQLRLSTLGNWKESVVAMGGYMYGWLGK